MKIKLSIKLIVLIFSVVLTAHAFAKTGANFKSTSDKLRAEVVELYSSEGCNSCPPADEWVAKLRTHPQLWKRLVPVEFHVDYWNRLGWNDVFSKKAFTQRQSNYAALWKKNGVYTPGFVLNGMEWSRDLSDLDSKIKSSKEEGGSLEVTQTGDRKFKVTYHPSSATKANSWMATGALLGNGFETKVLAGENKGKTLKHEFVVLATNSIVLGGDKVKGYSETITLPSAPGEDKAKSFSLAFWVSKNNELEPFQAAGGDWK